MNSEEFWRKTINSMKDDPLNEGIGPPEVETIPPVVKAPRRKRSEGSRQVTVQKIVTTVYVFTDLEGKAYTSTTSQNLYILGKMSLEEGLKLSQMDKANSEGE